MKNNGFGDFAIIRVCCRLKTISLLTRSFLEQAYRSLGNVDPNGANTIKNARAAGIPFVDAYIL